MKKILLDPGHGGHDPGALSPTGLKESDVALDVCKRMRDLLIGKVKVLLTRETDEFLTLGERAEIGNRLDVDLFLSVHCNSASSPSAKGFEVFTTPGDTLADPFATDLFNAYQAEFHDLSARKNLEDGDPDKEARFTVLTRSKCPAALFELEFIHTEKGDTMFRDELIRQRMAEALARGVLAHVGIKSDGATDTTDDVNRILAVSKIRDALILLENP